MKLQLAMRPFRLPLRAPVRTSHGTQGAVEGLHLLLRDGEGGVGLGEVTPLPAFGTETLAEAVRAIGTVLLPDRLDFPDGLGFCLQARAPVTRAGVEMAVQDLGRGVAASPWQPGSAVSAFTRCRSMPCCVGRRRKSLRAR